MTSIGYGDILPLTDYEKIVALFVMILGASVYGEIFGKFAASIKEFNKDSDEN